MHKIEIAVDEIPDMNTITQWCRENYGPGYYTITDENGKHIRKYRWRTSSTVKFEAVNVKFGSILKKYLVLFFEKEEHATWFAIRWT